MPKVSVVITTYNRAKYLEEAIRSILYQTYQDFEIIVVDDGSTDNTRQMVADMSNPKIRYIYQPNQGAGAARNTGVQACKGHLIAFLDADDIWLADKLEVQIKTLELHPQTAVIYSDMSFFGAVEPTTPQTCFQFLQWPPPRGNVLEKMIVRFFGHPSTLVVKREVFETVGLFDEKLPHCDDYDMLIRLAAYFEFEVVTTPLVKYRLHNNQISRNDERVIIDHLTVFSKALTLSGITPTIRRKLYRRIADFHFRYALVHIRVGKPGQGVKEILIAFKADFWRVIYLSFSIIGRLFESTFRRTNLNRAPHEIHS